MKEWQESHYNTVNYLLQLNQQAKFVHDYIVWGQTRCWTFFLMSKWQNVGLNLRVLSERWHASRIFSSFSQILCPEHFVLELYSFYIVSSQTLIWFLISLSCTDGIYHVANPQCLLGWSHPHGVCIKLLFKSPIIKAYTHSKCDLVS